MFQMFSVISLCAIVSSSISAPIYSIYKQYVQFEIFNKTSTIANAVYSTSSSTTTTEIDVIHKAEIISNSIDAYVKAARIIVPSIIAALLTILTFVFYAIKVYKNNCIVKLSWFTMKTPGEYHHRREHRNQQQIALSNVMQHIQQTSQTIYSIA